MRVAWCLLIAALAAGCGSSEVGSGRIERYGISLEVADGWDAQLSRGLVRIARGDVSVEIYEYDPWNASEATHFDGPWPVQLEAHEFGRLDDEQQRLVSASGRLFSVFAFGPPTNSELGEINAMLETVDVAAGDFYPGSVAPLELAQRSGWHVVSTGRGPRHAHGESTYAAAATVPYIDDPDALPPVRTLEALPRDGILVWVGLSRDARLPPSRIEGRTAYERTHAPPYRVGELERVVGWEGQVRDIPDYRLWGVIGDRYLVDLRVYFGRKEPTDDMLAEAEAMLAGMRFPDWGPWELEMA